jgi:hypothetical protein
MAEKDALTRDRDLARHYNKLDELRNVLMGDLSSDQLENMQMKVDMLMRLAALDGSHDHDSHGGVGDHDHSALADLSWRLEQPAPIIEVETAARTAKK